MSGPGNFQPTAFQGFKKAEDVSETLRTENAELKRLLNKTRADNAVLKSQLKNLSVVLDKAIHNGFSSVHYDVSLGRELTKQIEDNVHSLSKETERRVDMSKNNPSYADGSESTTASHDKKRDKRRFTSIAEFDEHNGSVMCARFSPNGNLIASGSFDRKVRIFDVFELNEGKKLQLDGHQMMVSHIAWHADSNQIASASYDSTCKLWDVTTGSHVSDFISPHSGFMLCDAWSTIDLNTIISSHSSSSIFFFDKRANQKPQIDIKHNCMVNTLQLLPSGLMLMGDRNGVVSIRDVRVANKSLETIDATSDAGVSTPVRGTATPVTSPGGTSSAGGSATGAATGAGVFDKGSFQVNHTKSQVSHISTVESGPEELIGRYLGVNAYDNILRIYDRGSLATEKEKAKEGLREPKLACKLMGQDFRLNGFPIHSSFWVGEQAGGKAKPLEERTLDETMLVASGSCPTNTGTDEQCQAYVYDITDVRKVGGGTLLQKLSGHTDHVYGMHCHPKHPLLISYSADCSIKLWSGRRH